MSELQTKKRRKKPTFPEGEFNEIPAVSYTNKEQKIFVKETKPSLRLITVKMPLSLYHELRETAFKTEDKITRIVIKAIEEYIRK
ncbi:MAG: hypothetical protein O7157_01865 [Wolbachia endosymbiont of Tetragnatha montana]|nr:hypothetical protein [Wolbachia endosymbiont of Tetragnatha montana]